jgi:hypothetical protein
MGILLRVFCHILTEVEDVAADDAAIYFVN